MLVSYSYPEFGGDIPSEMSVDFQRSARRNIPEGRTLHKHVCENIKSCVISIVSALHILMLLGYGNLTLSQLHRLLRMERENG